MLIQLWDGRCNTAAQSVGHYSALSVCGFNPVTDSKSVRAVRTAGLRGLSDCSSLMERQIYEIIQKLISLYLSFNSSFLPNCLSFEFYLHPTNKLLQISRSGHLKSCSVKKHESKTQKIVLKVLWRAKCPHSVMMRRTVKSFHQNSSQPSAEPGDPGSGARRHWAAFIWTNEAPPPALRPGVFTPPLLVH